MKIGYDMALKKMIDLDYKKQREGIWIKEAYKELGKNAPKKLHYLEKMNFITIHGNIDNDGGITVEKAGYDYQSNKILKLRLLTISGIVFPIIVSVIVNFIINYSNTVLFFKRLFNTINK